MSIVFLLLNPAATQGLQLREVHTPNPISWELAMGWWFVIIIVIAAVMIAAVQTYRTYKKRRYRFYALRQLKGIYKQYQEQPDLYLKHFMALLKRVALTAYSRSDVASLSGKKWLEFLDKSSKTNRFTRGDGKVLSDELYRPQPNINIKNLHQLGEYWIKKHQ